MTASVPQPDRECAPEESACGSDWAEDSALLQAKTQTSHFGEAAIPARESNGCQDTSPVICPRIQMLGYCDLSEDVRQACQKSCHACGSSPAPAPSPEPEVCQDLA